MNVTLSSSIPQLAAKLQANADRIALDTAEAIVERTKAAMDEPKSGRMYGAHQASAPGEAPAVLSGELQGSYTAEPDGVGRAVAYSDDPKAPLLEYGTRRMAARPALTPAAEIEQAAFENRLRGLLK